MTTRPFDAEQMAREIVDPNHLDLDDYDIDRLLIRVAAALQSLHNAHEAELAYWKDKASRWEEAARNECSRADTAEEALDAHEVEVRGLRKALTPSAETKAAYMGEFTFGVPDFDEGANEVVRHVNVPWTTIKAIMVAIRAFAEPETTEQQPSPAVPDAPRHKQP